MGLRLTALTAEQFMQMKEAVTNYQKLRRQLKQLEMLSRSIIFQNVPHPIRRENFWRCAPFFPSDRAPPWVVQGCPGKKPFKMQT